MKLAIAAALLLGTATLPALAQEHPPTERMDKSVPEMKSDTKNRTASHQECGCPYNEVD